MSNLRYLIPVIGVLIGVCAVCIPMELKAESRFQIDDLDNDRRLSRQEFSGSLKAFDRIDRNGDGYLTRHELRNSGKENNGRSNPDKSGDYPKKIDEQSLLEQTIPSTARSGSLRFVDTHMHLHPLGLDKAMSGDRASRMGEPLNEVANLAIAADNLVSRMDQQRLSQALVVVVPSSKSTPEVAYRNTRDAVRKHPNRLRLMGGGAILGTMLADTAKNDVNEKIKEQFRQEAEKILNEGAAGFGEMISYHLCMTERHSFKYTAPNHPLFLLLADIAAERDVPIDVHMEAIEQTSPMPDRLLKVCSKNPANLSPMIPDFEDLLRHNRKAMIVWQHIGWDNTGQMRPVLLRQLLTDHPNLYLSLRVPSKIIDNSGRPIPNRITDSNMKIKTEWKKLIEDYQDRVMLGADEFIGPGQEKTILAASFETTWSLIDQLPEKLSEKIGWKNAERVYRLK